MACGIPTTRFCVNKRKASDVYKRRREVNVLQWFKVSESMVDDIFHSFVHDEFLAGQSGQFTFSHTPNCFNDVACRFHLARNQKDTILHGILENDIRPHAIYRYFVISVTFVLEEGLRTFAKEYAVLVGVHGIVASVNVLQIGVECQNDTARNDFGKTTVLSASVSAYAAIPNMPSGTVTLAVLTWGVYSISQSEKTKNSFFMPLVRNFVSENTAPFSPRFSICLGILLMFSRLLQYEKLLR